MAVSTLKSGEDSVYANAHITCSAESCLSVVPFLSISISAYKKSHYYVRQTYALNEV
jgi:hypothetical protein